MGLQEPLDGFSLSALERGSRAVRTIQRELMRDETIVYGGLSKFRTRSPTGVSRTGVLAIAPGRLLWCPLRGSDVRELLRDTDRQADGQKGCNLAANSASRRRAREIHVGDWRLRDLENRDLDGLIKRWWSGNLPRSNQAGAESHAALTTLASLDDEHVAIVASALRPIGYVTLESELTVPARWVGRGEAVLGQPVRVEEGNDLFLARDISSTVSQ